MENLSLKSEALLYASVKVCNTCSSLLSVNERVYLPEIEIRPTLMLDKSSVFRYSMCHSDAE